MRYRRYPNEMQLRTHQAVDSGANLGVDVSTLALAKLDSDVNQTLILGLVDSCEDEGGVRGGILGLVSIDGYDPRVFRIQMNVRRRYWGTACSHSKSPESETTTVPVCFKWSREVVMVVVDGGEGERWRDWSRWRREGLL